MITNVKPFKNLRVPHNARGPPRMWEDRKKMCEVLLDCRRENFVMFAM